jgi:hypothetical protein
LTKSQLLRHLLPPKQRHWRGIVKSVDAKTYQLFIEVHSFQLPNGKENNIAPKNKTILVSAQTTWRGVASEGVKTSRRV